MKKNLQVLCFMSWENDEATEWSEERQMFVSTKIRAIALCEQNGYFYEAINCMRDGSMGEKDDNGVYSRHWYADTINCNGDEYASLRYATNEEIELYLSHVSLQNAVGDGKNYKVKIVDKEVSPYALFKYVIVTYELSFLERIKRFFNPKRLPF